MISERHAPNICVVLDLGQTVADMHGISLEVLRGLHPILVQVTPAAVIRAARPYYNHSFSFLFLNEAVMGTLLSGPPDTDFYLSQYRERVLDRLSRQREASVVARALVTAGIDIVIATNGTDSSASAILNALAIREYVPRDQVYTSERFGCLKNTGVIHHAIRQRFPDSTIWAVGDSFREDILPALRYGMRPIWIMGNLKDKLERMDASPGVVTTESLTDVLNIIGIPTAGDT